MRTTKSIAAATADRRWLLALNLSGLLATAVACESRDGDTEVSDSATIIDDASAVEDAGADADGEDGGVAGDGGLDGRASDGTVPEPTTLGELCTSDSECNDGVFCNGEERCQSATGDEGGALRCARARALPCPPEHACEERAPFPHCNCEIGDRDGDSYAASVCGGEDCDDGRPDVYPHATEVCDSAGRDEDCEPLTFHSLSTAGSLDGDEDGDGFVSADCRNYDSDAQIWHGGNDCDDHEANVKPGNTETCNYRDDDCNGLTDEALNPATGVVEEGFMMNTFRPDFDRDLHGDQQAATVRACIYTEPPGYIPVAAPLDCDDGDRTVHANAAEVCDGRDNDCNGEVDDEASLLREYSFVGTELTCQSGSWVITKCPGTDLWCPGDPISQGCRTDGTRLSSCHRCGTACTFSCGRNGCDEIRKVVAGGNQTCALTGDGRVACWGQGADGRLGTDSTSASMIPRWVVGIVDAREIAVGEAHACAVVGEDRTLWCWGRQTEGQLGVLDAAPYIATAVRSVGPRNSPAALTQVAQVSAGHAHTCVVRDGGDLLCFGEGSRGRLGNGRDAANLYTATPVVRERFSAELQTVQLRAVRDATAVTTGARHSCASLEDGTVACWGDNSNGELGDAFQAPSSLGIKVVAGLSEVSAISSGIHHTCAIARGHVYCWGDGTDLQLGHEPSAENGVATRVPGIESATRVAAGDYFTCAQTADAKVHCWGLNQDGQLGATSGLKSAQPLQVLEGEELAADSLSAGNAHACALRAGGAAVCWGSNFHGQLGIGSSSPFPGLTFTTVSAVAGSLP